MIWMKSTTKTAFFWMAHYDVWMWFKNIKCGLMLTYFHTSSIVLKTDWVLRRRSTSRYIGSMSKQGRVSVWKFPQKDVNNWPNWLHFCQCVCYDKIDDTDGVDNSGSDNDGYGCLTNEIVQLFARNLSYKFDLLMS